MFLMIDNYDSFVYNLVRYFEELNETIVVYQNDEITIGEIEKMDIKGIVISPGPKTPKEAGVSLNVIHAFHGKFPILGVCLGHQTIAVAFGGTVIRGEAPAHGIVSKISHNGKGIFKDIITPFDGTRYHSLIVEECSLPDCFTVTSKASDGVIMGIQHNSYPIFGIQFHPEAHLSLYGHEIVSNYITICNEFGEYKNINENKYH